MIRKFFSKLIQGKPLTPKKVYDGVISESLYERVTKDLTSSKYCEIIDTEEDFIKHLLYKLHHNNLSKIVKLKRMSNKSIDFSYNSYPVGKIKLQGKNTRMQILTSLYDQKIIENASQNEFINEIDLWIAYIKKFKLNS